MSKNKIPTVASALGPPLSDALFTALATPRADRTPEQNVIEVLSTVHLLTMDALVSTLNILDKDDFLLVKDKVDDLMNALGYDMGHVEDMEPEPDPTFDDREDPEPEFPDGEFLDTAPRYFGN